MTAAAMISFTCTGCGRPFTVPQTFAGRRATCKTCGASVTVPHPDRARPRAWPTRHAAAVLGGGFFGSPPTPTPPPNSPSRQRRLAADAAQLTAALTAAPHIKATPLAGDPP